MATETRDYRTPADPMILRAADRLYDACEDAVLAGRVDARSPIGDATLDYRDLRFNDPFALGSAADDAATADDDDDGDEDVPVARLIARAIRAAAKQQPTAEGQRLAYAIADYVAAAFDPGHLDGRPPWEQPR
jgi:cell pole-organizing protein PopZ